MITREFVPYTTQTKRNLKVWVKSHKYFRPQQNKRHTNDVFSKRVLKEFSDFVRNLNKVK